MTSTWHPASTRYAREINLHDRHNPHTLAVLLIGEQTSVLDIGTSTGTVAGALRERGSRVWGVEIDAAAAKEAAKVCEQMVVGDVEQLDLAAQLERRDFDWVLLLDVLEHLRDPLAVLKRCAPLLAPGGRVLLSVPNIAHASVRLDLLRGHFEYTDIGLLDRTHLRFFEQDSVRELISDAGLSIEQELPIRRSLEQESGASLDAVAPEVMRELEDDPASDIYQFVFVARPAGDRLAAQASENGRAGGAAQPTLLEEVWRQADDFEKQLRGLQAYVESILERSSDLERKAERAEELEGAIAERMSQLFARDRELKQLRLTLGLKERQLIDTRALLTDAQALLTDAELRAVDAEALRERVAVLEYENSQLAERMAYGRYRAADWLSNRVKAIPGVHPLARLVVELVFGRR